MADSNLLNQILTEILVCACNTLEDGYCGGEPSRCGCPCRTFITAGTPVWDIEACCSDGQLAVYLKDIYPSANFPSRSNNANACTPSLAANIAIQLLRCWPANVNDDGTSPNANQIQQASEDIYRDLYLLTWGIVCCLKTNTRSRQFVLNGSRIIGPTGGCVGAEVDITVELIAVN